ncbi:MAG: DoxX family protein [Alphaproteobacteria bacterium]|nr:DoxX family protein [Alphaproteobacteria bacterium]
MTIFAWVNRVALTLLSIMTGVVKLVQMPEEMQIFADAGFSTSATMAFGVVQLVGGLLLVPNATHRIGAVVMVPTFVAATGVLFVNGLVPFGVFSLTFIASAGLAAWKGPPPWTPA